MLVCLCVYMRACVRLFLCVCVRVRVRSCLYGYVLQRCDKCNLKMPGGTPVYIVIVIILTTFVFLALVRFNVGVTPTLDSWLFFMQVNKTLFTLSL